MASTLNMMRSLPATTDAILGSSVRQSGPAHRVMPRRSSMITRAEAPKVPGSEPVSAPSTAESSSTPLPAVAAPVTPPVTVQDFKIFSATTEAINGRAAMLGFAVALATEVSTGQSVWSQIAGKVVNERYVESAIGISSVTFAGAVVLLTMATFAPMVIGGEGINSRSFGPFKPSIELNVGRLAMVGFSGLVLVETLFRGNTAIF